MEEAARDALDARSDHRHLVRLGGLAEVAHDGEEGVRDEAARGGVVHRPRLVLAQHALEHLLALAHAVGHARLALQRLRLRRRERLLRLAAAAILLGGGTLACMNAA